MFPYEQMMVEEIDKNYLKLPSFKTYNMKENLKKDLSRSQSRVILEALKKCGTAFSCSVVFLTAKLAPTHST